MVASMAQSVPETRPHSASFRTRWGRRNEPQTQTFARKCRRRCADAFRFRFWFRFWFTFTFKVKRLSRAFLASLGRLGALRATCKSTNPPLTLRPHQYGRDDARLRIARHI